MFFELSFLANVLVIVKALMQYIKVLANVSVIENALKSVYYQLSFCNIHKHQEVTSNDYIDKASG